MRAIRLTFIKVEEDVVSAVSNDDIPDYLDDPNYFTSRYFLRFWSSFISLVRQKLELSSFVCRKSLSDVSH